MMEFLDFNEENDITLPERYLLAAAFSTHPSYKLLNDLLVSGKVEAKIVYLEHFVFNLFEPINEFWETLGLSFNCMHFLDGNIVHQYSFHVSSSSEKSCYTNSDIAFTLTDDRPWLWLRTQEERTVGFGNVFLGFIFLSFQGETHTHTHKHIHKMLAFRGESWIRPRNESVRNRPNPWF